MVGWIVAAALYALGTILAVEIGFTLNRPLRWNDRVAIVLWPGILILGILSAFFVRKA